MSDELRDQIYNNMNLKDTDELLEIWQKNDHVEWSDSALDIVKEVLEKRGVEIPEQDDAIYEYDENYNEEPDEESYSFSEVDLKIIDDENPPDFYDPFEVLKIGKWLDLAAKAIVILTVIQTLFAFQTFKSISFSFFRNDPNSAFVYILVIIMMLIVVLIGVLIYYLPLRALSHVLTILMEMEFNSRKAK
jgi:hypothetical protein